MSVFIVYCSITNHLKTEWLKTTISWIGNSRMALLIGSDLRSIISLQSDGDWNWGQQEASSLMFLVSVLGSLQ